ncbi:MAG: hypothetical protein FWB95_01520 [Treponema sp.]|nr:hypothetical protein [Treponema sp.]
MYMEDTDSEIPAVSLELGSRFTWSNPDQPNQKGWALDNNLRAKIADGTVRYFIIALDAETVKTDGGLGGVEVSFNAQILGFRMDHRSFPWNWDIITQTGGYASYNLLFSGGHATLDSEIIHLRYDITTHPDYKEFKKEMSDAEWGEISIQYGIGIRILPFINAYLQG